MTINYEYSVIIPLYNSKTTIEKTINSVVCQTFSSPIEIIVVNDGSTDGSEHIVDKIIKNNQTNRLIKLINQENCGVSSARNIGIASANGKFIAFLDSDDIWHSHKLDIIQSILIDNHNVSFIGHSYTIKSSFPEINELNKPIKISFFKLLVRNFAQTSCIVIKKDICDSFNEKMTHTEDHELWLRIALKHEVYYVDLPLVKLNRPQLSKGGLSSNTWKMRKGEIQMYINIAKRKKALIPSVPFLISFSLLKHLRKIITNRINPLK